MAARHCQHQGGIMTVYVLSGHDFQPLINFAAQFLRHLFGG